MKTSTFTIDVPVIEKDECGNITELSYREKEFGIPDCVVFENSFRLEVQRYVNIAYAEYFQWESDKQYAAYEKKGVSNDWEKYSVFANEVKPINVEKHCDFAFMYAFCIDKRVQTHYYRDSKGKYTSCGITIGEYGTQLYELFKDYSFSTINDKTMSIARQQLRAWFGDVISNDSNCKDWDTKKINIDTTRQLINLAGNVTTKMRRDFIHKSTTISVFTEQALAKCFYRCFKMKPAPIETEKVFVVKD